MNNASVYMIIKHQSVYAAAYAVYTGSTVLQGDPLI